MTETMQCKYCQFAGPHDTEILQSGVHHARENCGKCGRWIRFIPKPDSDPTKYKRSNQHKDLVDKYGRGYCEMCLRKTDQLPKGQTLEGQHVLEYELHDGSSDRENIWIVCTSCHKLIHWVRTYRHKPDGDMLIGPVIDKIMNRLEADNGD